MDSIGFLQKGQFFIDFTHLRHMPVCLHGINLVICAFFSRQISHSSPYNYQNNTVNSFCVSFFCISFFWVSFFWVSFFSVSFFLFSLVIGLAYEMYIHSFINRRTTYYVNTARTIQNHNFYRPLFITHRTSKTFIFTFT